MALGLDASFAAGARPLTGTAHIWDDCYGRYDRDDKEKAVRKTVSAVRARGKLGQMLEEVYYRGDQYVIERAGKAMAAVVPVEQYEQWRRERDAFFELVEELRSRNAKADPAQVEKDAAAARRRRR